MVGVEPRAVIATARNSRWNQRIRKNTAMGRRVEDIENRTKLMEEEERLAGGLHPSE